MRLTKEKKVEFRKVKSRLVNLIKSCNKDYDKLTFALKEIFTKITDADSPRISEFNETYKVYELAECSSVTLHIYKFEKMFGQIRPLYVQPEIYFYDKAPMGIVIVVAVYFPELKKKIPMDLNLYIIEN